MKGGFRQSMAWLHTWTGLILGWLLYFMFVTGTAGYLDTEIDRWMRPEAPRIATDIADRDAIERGLAYLRQQAPDAGKWSVLPPSGRDIPALLTFWQGGEGDGEGGRGILDPATGEEIETRDTGGGQLLYRMHWRLHYLPDLLSGWLVSIATMLMFVAIISGVITHKKIFKDFFTFRPGKGQRSWLDAHNALSVLTLPFQLMITYSGLIFMMFVCMPWIVAAFYGTSEAGRDEFFHEIFPEPAHVETAGPPAELVALDGPLATAADRWGEGSVRSVEIEHPGHANARITLHGSIASTPLRDAPSLTFHGVSGALLAEQTVGTSAIRATRDVFLGLHEGLFAGPVLRALYLLAGLLGTGMIATGLVLWTVKRRQTLDATGKGSARGLALVERLNIGTVVGLPVAVAAYFWANRLIPADFSQRADWEVHAMFLTWAAMLVHAALRPRDRAWVEQFAIGAAACGLLPVVNALTTDRDLAHSLATGDWLFAGFDLFMLVTAVASAAMAWRLARRRAAPDASRRGRRMRNRPIGASHEPAASNTSRQ